MSPSDALSAAAVIFTVFATFFIAYRALRLRRALVDRPYRTRALWTAIGAFSVLSLDVSGISTSIYGETPTTVTGVLVEGALFGFAFLMLYGWIVTNINVAILADFFNRDALLWKRVGRIAAPVVIVFAFVLASLPPWWIPSADSNLGLDIVDVLFYATTLYAAVVLAISYRRIKNRQIKSYTLWVVLSVLAIFAQFLVPSDLVLIPSVAWFFFMYKSVDSLTIRTRNLNQV